MKNGTQGFSPSGGFSRVDRIKDFLTRESECHTPVFQHSLNATETPLADDVWSKRSVNPNAT
ncbi:hypothetical protein OKW43_007245 [Paraburkholderia sp. WC7.3g]|uniref:Uncharacterized protein n=1 Tax=Paraburkholderia podalyriae TaxID=1938811 RepID=A0ABR7PJI6_9BURK|nr:hypothetical protein [Paraburkholderia podalyriae]MBC8746538.1 hypothetical protein [Paraburkholderia podalyriae]